jgi:hypothetical protein
LGIDLDTIDEINQVNKGLEDELGIELPIELEDLEESNDANSHWDGLVGITKEAANSTSHYLLMKNCSIVAICWPSLLFWEVTLHS